MAKSGELKRKIDELDTELESQHKRMRLLENDIENILADNRYLTDKCEDYEDRIAKLENDVKSCSSGKYNLRPSIDTTRKRAITASNRGDDDTSSADETPISEHDTEDLVESDSVDDDEQNPKRTKYLSSIVKDLIPAAIMMGTAMAASGAMGAYQEDADYPDDASDASGVISPKSRQPDSSKMKINTKKKYDEYTRNLVDYFTQHNLRNVSNINYCIDHFNKQEIAYSQKTHHLELCKSLLNHEYINTTSKDLKYFVEIDLHQKTHIVSSIVEIAKYTENQAPIIYDILQRNMSPYQKYIIIDKVKQLAKMHSHDSEYHKLKKWLDTVMAIPFNNSHRLQISMTTHSPLMIDDYLRTTRKTLDNVIHGQTKTKDHIIQIISKLISNPAKGGNVFAIYGPPGTGKTTIVKNGLSTALKMPFAFISLGGATDSSYLDGHNYTYEGSTAGRIVDVVIQSKCMNPIFYFDELDKVSKTHKGDEIINLLIHLIDSSQNNHFQDKYLAGITLDLSQSIFVFSFNDITKINPILLDRMELIKVEGFNGGEKITIARDYLLPEIMSNYAIPQGEVVFPDEIINYIIDHGVHASKEEGVRNIKRRIENIVSKLNVLIISGSLDSHIVGSRILDDPIHSNIPDVIKHIDDKRPIIITREIVDILVNTTIENDKEPPFGMYL